jgi:hypothetical protein
MTDQLEDWEVLLYAVLFIGTFPTLALLFWIADKTGFGKHVPRPIPSEDEDRLTPETGHPRLKAEIHRNA